MMPTIAQRERATEMKQTVDCSKRESETPVATRDSPRITFTNDQITQSVVGQDTLSTIHATPECEEQTGADMPSVY
jgi:hypothetical protein